jgi:SAM-dependent methyltransferase
MNSHPAHHDHGSETDEAPLAALLDLDAEVLDSYLQDLVGWVHDLAGEPPPRRILDVGSGTGTGALSLLRSFDGASAVALDVSDYMLSRLRDKARDLGLADRIVTVQADLDATWPAVGTVDLVWASASLHHMADPEHALAEIFAALRPGGVVAAIELDRFPRFLPDDIGLGRPGLEERCHAAIDRERAHALPHLGSDWGQRLSQAGFTIQAQRSFEIELTPPLPAGAGRYAQASLRRLRSALDGQLGEEDLAVLDTILDSEGPEGVLRRDDLTIRAARTAWVARRP